VGEKLGMDWCHGRLDHRAEVVGASDGASTTHSRSDLLVISMSVDDTVKDARVLRNPKDFTIAAEISPWRSVFGFRRGEIQARTLRLSAKAGVQISGSWMIQGRPQRGVSEIQRFLRRSSFS